MRKDQDFRLPGAMPSDINQAHQLKPHEGFAPHALTRRAEPKFKTAGQPVDSYLARPPEWQREGLCVGKSDLFDNPNAATFRNVVKPLCDACPVRDICGETALAEEGNLPASFRATVRGGLRPQERARLSESRPAQPAACARSGHSMRGKGEAYWNAGRRCWDCATCKRERKAAQKAAGTGEYAPVPCKDCGKVLQVRQMRRHVEESCPGREEQVA